MITRRDALARLAALSSCALLDGDADTTVPVAVTRARIAVLRKAGAHPLVTEYAGVNHNSSEWAFTVPALLPGLFAHQSS